VLRDPSDDSALALTVLIEAAAGRRAAVLGFRGADAAPLADVARVLERAALRFGVVTVWAESEALAPAEPDEPDEPVVSANASGIATTAEPTPNATANAPTRPTTTKPDINDSSWITGHSAATASGPSLSTQPSPPVSVKLRNFFQSDASRRPQKPGRTGHNGHQ